MNHRPICFAILGGALMLLAGACARQVFDPDTEPTPAEQVRLELTLQYLSETQPVQTKAPTTSDQEAEIVADRVWVLVVDDQPNEANRTLKQAPAKAEWAENRKIIATLHPETSNSWVYVLANVTDAASAYLANLASGTTLGAIINHPTMKLTEATTSGLTAPFPMWGTTGSVVAQIRTGEVLLAAVNLVRAVARIDVVVDPTIPASNFRIRRATVVNAAKSGWLFTPSPIPAQRLTDAVRYPSAGIVSSIAPGVDHAIVQQMYCYENNGLIDAVNQNPTRIVIEGYYAGKTTPSFYGIDITYLSARGGADERYDIERNKIYTVNIKKIDKDGYERFDLAEHSASFNSGMVADVTVTDPYSHNIVSNGKQYMGTTNTNLLVYTKGLEHGAKNVLAATISYTTENGWPRGTMTASQGITFVVSGTQTETLEVGSGNTPVIRDVLIDIANTVIMGTIEVRIGNLSQVIRVINHRVTAAGGDVIDYFPQGGAGAGSQTDFVTAEVITPSPDNAWLKVSDDISALQPSALFNKITNPAGKIYVHVAGNIAYNSSSATARKAQVFVTSKNNEQRYRVHIEQNYLDVYSDARPIKPYTYVGVFHRWNETAERLIRIEGNQLSYGEAGSVALSGTWVASVVSGDFIMLSTQPSKDPMIDPQDPYGYWGVSTWDAATLEGSGRFEANEGRRVVSGTISASTPNIYFKVGLTGPLASFDAPPRYGLIALTYNTGSGVAATNQTQFIYVRQGEQADYLMRPSDPVLYTAAYWWNNFTNQAASNPTALNNAREPMPTRPQARKIAPYNLRASAPNFVGSRSNISLDQHEFVDYPSKGGDYYFSNGNKVVRKQDYYLTSAQVATSGGWIRSVSETCPYGYRRISDTQAPITGAIEGSITVAGSENRQSLWLFPMKNLYLSNFSNQIRGYLADGYFDRQKIAENKKSYDGGLVKSYHHAVVRGSNSGLDDPDLQHAYWGYLLFNPYNYASVFMPLAGMYSSTSTSSFYYDEAAFAGIFTTSRYSVTTTGNDPANSFWINNFGHIGGNEVYDNYKSSSPNNAYSIRCVRDEGEPIVGPIEGAVSVTPFAAGNGQEYYNVRIEYQPGQGSLQAQLNAALGAKLPQMNTLTVVCTLGRSLQSDDYTYLNTLADQAPSLGATYSLHHLVIRGAGNQTIPAGAFTSRCWRSITLIDAQTIADGAFSLPINSLLHNLSIGYFGSDLGIGSQAFSAGIDTRTVNLKIRGWALAQATPPTWLGLEWNTITLYP